MVKEYSGDFVVIKVKLYCIFSQIRNFPEISLMTFSKIGEYFLNAATESICEKSARQHFGQN